MKIILYEKYTIGLQYYHYNYTSKTNKLKVIWNIEGLLNCK